MPTRLAFEGLTKRFGPTTAVDHLTATIQPGVTVFLGPNGAGKTTTLRMLLGLARPTAGTATIDGRRYDELTAPALTIGALLETTAFHPGRRAVDHLRVIAAAAGLDRDAPARALQSVSLTSAARRKVGSYSLGMRQRLGLATALLGDPEVLVLDEPTNGLDPEGMRWLRDSVRAMAGQGRTVLLSSHDLSEVEQVADHVLVLAYGRLVWQGPLGDLRRRSTSTVVATPDIGRLIDLLSNLGHRIDRVAPHTARTSVSPETVGSLAACHRIALHHLAASAPTLEELFFDLTGGHQCAT